MPGGAFAGAGGSTLTPGKLFAGPGELRKKAGEPLTGAGGSTLTPGELSAGPGETFAGLFSESAGLLSSFAGP